jgi:hypothetical protein
MGLDHRKSPNATAQIILYPEQARHAAPTESAQPRKRLLPLADLIDDLLLSLRATFFATHPHTKECIRPFTTVKMMTSSAVFEQLF